MEFHIDQLRKHCRICGNRLTKSKGRSQPVYTCADFREDLLSHAGLDLVDDEDDMLVPLHFCNCCYMKLDRVKKAKETSTPTQPIQPVEWTPHNEDCKVRSLQIIIIITITTIIIYNIKITKKNLFNTP